MVNELTKIELPGYERVTELGRGAMGVVYKAIRIDDNQPVAIKVIVPAGATSENAMQLFVREASILSQLRHPQIVGFHEFGLANGLMYLVMEYVPEIDFEALIKRAHAKPSQQVRLVCGMATQILAALHHAHKQSLIHRDIKPSNILVAHIDGKYQAKLADFGLAKNYVNAGFSGVTDDGLVGGTLSFMPPEQALDYRYAKPAADIYSLAATLYFFLSGKVPRPDCVEGEKINVVMNKRIPPLESLRPDIPIELARTINRAMAKDPQDRFPTAKAFREKLLPWIKK